MESAPVASDPTRVRPAALAALVANVGIVLTGGIVRVTGSGLGCEDWPTCDGTNVVPAAGADGGWHTWIEFGNRLLTFVVLAAAVWVVVAARRHARGDRDLQRLAWLQPAGVLGQAVLGGITVLTDLHPLVVASHFLLSMAVIAAAVVLLDRCTPDRRRPPAAMRATSTSSRTDATELPALRWLARLLVVVGGGVLVLGTLVTAAGPHAGDPGTPRLAADIRSLAFAHADGVWLLVGLTVATVVVGAATGDDRIRNAAAVALAIEAGQGSIGYIQYALGIPPELVSLHILGAALVWVAVLRTALALAPRGPRHAPATDPDPAAARQPKDRAVSQPAP